MQILHFHCFLAHISVICILTSALFHVISYDDFQFVLQKYFNIFTNIVTHLEILLLLSIWSALILASVHMEKFTDWWRFQLIVA